MTGWSVDDVQAALDELDADLFASHVVLDRVPWLWSDRRAYVEWKTALAHELRVDPYSLVVVGSAATGVTLNPRKTLFREFGEESDIDVAVVSHHHFEIAWRVLREMGENGHIPTRAERRDRQSHRRSLIFDATIATDRMLDRLPFGEEWRRALAEAEQRLPCGWREVKARIYRDVDALRAYQVRNIRQLKDEIDASLPAEEAALEGAPIPIVDENPIVGDRLK